MRNWPKYSCLMFIKNCLVQFLCIHIPEISKYGKVCRQSKILSCQFIKLFYDIPDGIYFFNMIKYGLSKLRNHKWNHLYSRPHGEILDPAECRLYRVLASLVNRDGEPAAELEEIVLFSK